MKRTILYVVVAMLATVSFAQENNRMRRREFNPEEYALRLTQMLNQELKLDSVQYQAVLLMNYADALTMQDSINARHARMEKVRVEGKKPERVRPSDEQRQAMMELQKQREEVRNEQMKQILNAEQYEKYLKYQEEQRERMRQMRGRRGHGRPGGFENNRPRVKL